METLVFNACLKECVNVFQVQGRLNDFLKLKNSKNICESQKPRQLGRLKRSKITKKRTISGIYKELFSIKQSLSM